MATTVSMINMKGGVGKTTLCFNLAWYAAWQRDLRVLTVDLDPQANLSQYFMGAEGYLNHITSGASTVVEVFEQFSLPSATRPAPAPLEPARVIHSHREWADGSLLHLIPSRLELAWTLKNPTEKAHLLPGILAKVADDYDLILIDCAPTESILTVFDNEARHSNSYATGSRAGTAIFHTSYARDYVKAEFASVGTEFLERVELI